MLIHIYTLCASLQGWVLYRCIDLRAGAGPVGITWKVRPAEAESIRARARGLLFIQSSWSGSQAQDACIRLSSNCEEVMLCIVSNV